MASLTLYGRQREAEAAQRREVAERKAARVADRDDLPPGQWLSSRGAAALLGCSTVWVNRLASQDRLPHIVRAGQHRFRHDHIMLIVNA